jgi:hypothetical protein
VDPGEHLPFFFIDAHRARCPRDICGLEIEAVLNADPV